MWSPLPTSSVHSACILIATLTHTCKRSHAQWLCLSSPVVQGDEGPAGVMGLPGQPGVAVKGEKGAEGEQGPIGRLQGEP